MNVEILILGYLLFSVFSFMAAGSAKKQIFYITLLLGAALLLVHGGTILWRGIEAKHLPFTNMFETLVLMAFFILALYFLTFPWHKSSVLGGFAAVVACVILALTGFLPSDIEPLLPALKSNWLLFHVTTVITGYASFA
ncbi:MAG: hypothetical protein HY586_00200, partial [Candidatus Omnitrophica bacterium]|nr:hypothetical protein [Candidatus Omnitrophota bacterium]